MRAAYMLESREIVIKDIATPEIKKDTDVLIRVKKVGICGSDVHYYKEGCIGNQVVKGEIILGHEAAGEVVETGDAVTSVKKGQKVAIEPGISCGRCEPCKEGRPNLCPDVEFFGTPPIDGALREFVVMPEECLFPLPEGLGYDEGVLSEPLSIGIYGVRLGDFRLGQDAAITGAGPIGLSVLFAVKAAGARRVFISDLLPERLRMAEKLGADRTVDAKKDNIAEIVMKETGGRGVDVGFEAAGQQATFTDSTDSVRIGGRAVIYGIPSDDRMEFTAHKIRRKEMSIINVRRASHTTETALELIADKGRDFRGLVTHSFPLENVREAIDLVAGYRDGVIKAVIEI